MGDKQYHLKFSADKGKAVDDYLEYTRIVGEDDGGELFTPEEYEQYKKKVLPMRLENRLYTSWTSSTGMDCKLIGPETPCFCQHRYKQHKTDFDRIPEERPIMLPCRQRGCKCVSYHYVPLMGGQTIRCTCKHLASEHDPAAPYMCNKSICQKCAGFKSSYSCGCGESYMLHSMVVETRQEREARGHPVGHDVPYQAMGGITGFSSLAEGYQRLDPSGQGSSVTSDVVTDGAGAPSDEWLSQEITANDHTFLRGHVNSIQAHRRATKDYDRLDEDLTERMSAMKTSEESDMDFFERRYKERLAAEKASKRQIAPGPSARGVRKSPGERTSASTSRSGSRASSSKEGLS